MKISSDLINLLCHYMNSQKEKKYVGCWSYRAHTQVTNENSEFIK